MNAITITAGLPKPQRCNPPKFFYVLDRIELTTLLEAVAGPKRRGAHLKELQASLRLHLWYLWLRLSDIDNPPSVASLHRELHDPGSALGQLCKFEEGKIPPCQRTLSNHFRLFEKHHDSVLDVLSKINQWIPSGAPITQSPKPKKAEKAKTTEEDRRAKETGKEPHTEEESEPSTRDKENIDYRRRRRNEAMGRRELDSIVGTEDAANDFLASAIHGDSRSCHVCAEKRAQGWICTKDHAHRVVKEAKTQQGQRRQWKCLCCESKLSVTSGTIFHGTNFSCQEILIALYEMVRSRYGVSAQHVAGALNEAGRNVSEGAALTLMHRLRECMWEGKLRRFVGETEIDEMLLHLNDGKMVSLLVAYNRPTGRVRYRIVERQGGKKPKANKREMLKYIREVTIHGSTILSDGDAAIPKAGVMRRYHGVIPHNGRKGRKFLAYMRLHGEFGKETEITTNRVEGTNSTARRSFRNRNGIGRHHLDRYLMELAWRINYQHNKVESQNYKGEERRELSLMRDILAGATRRKLVLGDMRGEPHKKRDRALEKNRTAPVSASSQPQQPPLMPSEPIGLGAPQYGSGKEGLKPHQVLEGSQSENGKAEMNPPRTAAPQLPLALSDSQRDYEQPQQVPPDEKAVRSRPVRPGPHRSLLASKPEHVKVRRNPCLTESLQLSLAFGDSQKQDEQPQQMSPIGTAEEGKSAQCDLLEELEEIFAAMGLQRDSVGHPDPVASP